jgi:hypothetical protein
MTVKLEPTTLGLAVKTLITFFITVSLATAPSPEEDSSLDLAKLLKKLAEACASRISTPT